MQKMRRLPGSGCSLTCTCVCVGHTAYQQQASINEQSAALQKLVDLQAADEIVTTRCMLPQQHRCLLPPRVAAGLAAVALLVSGSVGACC